MNFETWMADVGRLVEDLPGWPYRDAYENGMEVETAAHLIGLQHVYRARLMWKYGFSKEAFNRKDEHDDNSQGPRLA